jgi:outer membrane autotransporter protein
MLALGSGAQLQPYARVALANEFASGNEISVNATRFSSDFPGGRVELALGLTAKLTHLLHIYGEYSYTRGARLEKPWGLTAGLRYIW